MDLGVLTSCKSFRTPVIKWTGPIPLPTRPPPLREPPSLPPSELPPASPQPERPRRASSSPARGFSRPPPRPAPRPPRRPSPRCLPRGLWMNLPTVSFKVVGKGGLSVRLTRPSTRQWGPRCWPDDWGPRSERQTAPAPSRWPWRSRGAGRPTPPAPACPCTGPRSGRRA